MFDLPKYGEGKGALIGYMTVEDGRVWTRQGNISEPFKGGTTKVNKAHAARRAAALRLTEVN